MNNKEIKNSQKEVPSGIKMNDRDYLNCVLETEKNMSNNLSYALNEVSNDALFDKIYNIFDEIKNNARDAYNLAFKNGWYKLEKAQDNKITEKVNELQQKYNELNEESNSNENS